MNKKQGVTEKIAIFEDELKRLIETRDRLKELPITSQIEEELEVIRCTINKLRIKINYHKLKIPVNSEHRRVQLAKFAKNIPISNEQ